MAPPRFHKVAFTNFKAVYQSCATDSDVLAVCDGGSVKGTAEVKKAMSAMGAFSTSIFLIPDQDSMQTRKDFSKKRQPADCANHSLYDLSNLFVCDWGCQKSSILMSG